MNAVAQGNEYDDEIELVLAYHKGDVRAAIEALLKDRDFLVKDDRVCQPGNVDRVLARLEANNVSKMTRSRGTESLTV